MIRTDGTPTIAWAPLPEPIADGRDPGDENDYFDEAVKVTVEEPAEGSR